ncbi:MalM family protein [Salicola sp. Rm-C-2C1-2]|uniref:MalM family protein n=1 Tax=Salicola sp. Rm-C-2C1-2 TaxID=3141321 RepID=UPI0032E3A12D
MSKPKPRSPLPISRFAAGSERLAPALLALMVLVAGGCTTGGSEAAKGGMRAWVDERGQVRYAPGPQENDANETDSQPEKDSGFENTASPHRQGQGGAHPEFNLEQYPDAGEKAQNGDTNELFYSWRNAEGRVFNTPYLYEEETMGRVIREEAPVRASQARVITSEAVNAPGFRPDSEAADVLGVGKGGRNRLNSFSEQCCGQLPRLEFQKLEPERTLPVNLGEETRVHRFSTGKSRFCLVRLPEEPERSLIRIRSFVRNGGYLVPSAVFLNGGFQPVRIVTDLVMEYSPETWRRYGHMSARLAIRPKSDERWLVLFTRSDDLESSTEVGKEGQRHRLTHESAGSLSLRLVD